MNKKHHDIDAFGSHDHGSCIEGGIAAAQLHCKTNGLQLTASRLRVLEVLLTEHRAMGAYEILEHFDNAQPPMVYRALEFLVKHGFAHKIERLNAFVGCSLPAVDHTPAFLICHDCNGVSETQSRDFLGGVADTADKTGFQVDRTIVEVLGLCPACQVAK